MSEASADHGTVLPAASWAIVWTPGEGFSLMMPPPSDDGTALVAREAMAMTGAFLRLNDDEDFRDECARHFMDATDA